jgi:hypothetical protein
MSGLDCLGAFDYLSLVQAGGGLLQGAGGLLSGGGGGKGGGGKTAEQQKLEDEKARAEKSASTMKTVLIVGGVALGIGGIGLAFALGGRR